MPKMKEPLKWLNEPVPINLPLETMNRALDKCEEEYGHTAYWVSCDEVQEVIKSFINKQEQKCKQNSSQ